ncbi:MAG: FG-GAP repeat protein [Xanthomonadales bacterium]|nr:FG-GAP repeat protein [Xanthomonadales bacterium]
MAEQTPDQRVQNIDDGFLPLFCQRNLFRYFARNAGRSIGKLLTTRGLTDDSAYPISSVFKISRFLDFSIEYEQNPGTFSDPSMMYCPLKSLERDLIDISARKHGFPRIIGMGLVVLLTGASAWAGDHEAEIAVVRSSHNAAFSAAHQDFAGTDVNLAGITEIQIDDPRAGLTHDVFGFSTAISGDTLLIGAPRDETVAGIKDGAAYIFVRSGQSWNLQARIVANDAHEGNYFGGPVALSGDTALIGAGGNSGAGEYSGSVYVFKRTGNSWAQQAKLIPSDSAAYDYFGNSISLSGDTALIGRTSESFLPIPKVGAAYVFVRQGSSWSQQTKLVGNDVLVQDDFGRSVAISGETAVVGSPFTSTAAGDNVGSAYVFQRSGTSWSQRQKLVAPDAASGDFFGNAIAVSGNHMLVGAPRHANTTGALAGAAYVFALSGASWSVQSELGAADGAASDSFGGAVAISDELALVGAYYSANMGVAAAGTAHVYSRAGDQWIPRSRLAASESVDHGYFGFSVALTGTTLVVGAPGGDGGFTGTSGVCSAHVYEVSELIFSNGFE